MSNELILGNMNTALAVTKPEYNLINFVTIATTGNAAYFGDLTNVMNEGGGLSNCHGGL